MRFRRMIFAGRNGILNNGGTPRKGASALHTEAIANTATAFRFMDSIQAKKIGDCGLSRKRARVRVGEMRSIVRITHRN